MKALWSQFDLVKTFFYSLLLSLFMVASQSDVIAQNATLEMPVATLNADGILQLPANQPLAPKYTFDLSSFSFANDAEMVEFLSEKSGDAYIVRAIPHLNKGILSIQCDQHQNWSCSEWNAHLSQQCTLKPIKQ